MLKRLKLKKFNCLNIKEIKFFIVNLKFLRKEIKISLTKGNTSDFLFSPGLVKIFNMF